MQERNAIPESLQNILDIKTLSYHFFVSALVLKLIVELTPYAQPYFQQIENKLNRIAGSNQAIRIKEFLLNFSLQDLDPRLNVRRLSQSPIKEGAQLLLKLFLLVVLMERLFYATNSSINWAKDNFDSTYNYITNNFTNLLAMIALSRMYMHYELNRDRNRANIERNINELMDTVRDLFGPLFQQNQADRNDPIFQRADHHHAMPHNNDRRFGPAIARFGLHPVALQQPAQLSLDDAQLSLDEYIDQVDDYDGREEPLESVRRLFR